MKVRLIKKDVVNGKLCDAGTVFAMSTPRALSGIRDGIFEKVASDSTLKKSVKEVKPNDN